MRMNVKAVTSLIASVCMCTQMHAQQLLEKVRLLAQLLGDQVSCWLHCSACKLIDCAIIFHLLMALIRVV